MRIKMPKFVRNYIANRLWEEINGDVDVVSDVKLHDLSLDTKGSNYRLHMNVTVDIDKRRLWKCIKQR